jgi:hypothetical protein
VTAGATAPAGAAAPAVAAAPAGAAAPAVAASAGVTESRRPQAIALNLGLFSAVGTLGLTYERDFGSRLAVEAGLGLGFTGVQMSLMPKLTLGGPDARFTAGVGLAYSVGDDARSGLWLNADLAGFEVKTDGGFFVSGAAGLTWAIAGPDECDSEWGCGHLVRGMLGPQLRFGVGYAF